MSEAKKSWPNGRPACPKCQNAARGECDCERDETLEILNMTEEEWEDNCEGSWD